MKTFFGVSLIALMITFGTVVSRAQQPSAQSQPGMAMSHDDEAAIQANLAKLNPDDRKLALAQKFCAIQTKNRLGSMGTPIKILIKDQPVFLCCKGCVAKAQANPDKTLASVADLIKANKKDDPKKPVSTKS